MQLIAKKCLQHNANFAHPENVLSAMLCDADPEVRKEAVQKILAVRSGKRKAPRSKVTRGIRFFKPPPLDWKSSSYDHY